MANRKVTALSALANLAATARLYAAEGGAPYQVSPENLSRAMFAHLPVWDLDTDIATNTTAATGSPVNGTISGTAPQFIFDMTSAASQLSIECITPALTIDSAPRVMELTSWQAISGTLTNGSVVLGMADSADSPTDLLTQFGGGALDNAFQAVATKSTLGGVTFILQCFEGGVSTVNITKNLKGIDENDPVFLRYYGSLANLTVEVYAGAKKVLSTTGLDYTGLAGMRPYLGLVSNDTTVDLQATYNISAPNWAGPASAPATQGALTVPTDNAGRAYRINATGTKVVLGPEAVVDDDIVVFDDAGNDTFYIVPSRTSAIAYDASKNLEEFLSGVSSEGVYDVVWSATAVANGTTVFNTFSTMYNYLISLPSEVEKRVWILESVESAGSELNMDAGTYALGSNRISLIGALNPLSTVGQFVGIPEGVVIADWYWGENITLQNEATATTPFEPASGTTYRFGDFCSLINNGSVPMFVGGAGAIVGIWMGRRAILSGTDLFSWSNTPSTARVEVILGPLATLGSGIIDQDASAPSSGNAVDFYTNGSISYQAIANDSYWGFGATTYNNDPVLVTKGPAGSSGQLVQHLQRTEKRYRFELFAIGSGDDIDNVYSFTSFQTLLDNAAAIKALESPAGINTPMNILEVVLDDSINASTISLNSIDWTDTNAAGWDAIVFTSRGSYVSVPFTAQKLRCQFSGTGTFSGLTDAGAGTVVFRNIRLENATSSAMFNGTSDPDIVFDNADWSGSGSSFPLSTATSPTIEIRGHCTMDHDNGGNGQLYSLTSTGTFNIIGGHLILETGVLGAATGTLVINADNGAAHIPTAIRSSLATLTINVTHGQMIDSEFVGVVDSTFVTGANNSLKDVLDTNWAFGIRSRNYAASATLNQNTVAMCESDAATITLTLDDTDLPSQVSNKFWPVHVIVDEGGNAATNNITLSPASGTINGGASLTINTDNAVWLVGKNSSTTWFAVQIA